MGGLFEYRHLAYKPAGYRDITQKMGIELFFKDCRTLLHFGKEQNQDFDGILAYHSLVFIRDILIAYILREKGIYPV